VEFTFIVDIGVGIEAESMEVNTLSGCSSWGGFFFINIGNFKQLLSSLTNESGSKLRQLQTGALSACLSLKSICLPAWVEFLCVALFVKSRYYFTRGKLKECQGGT
jgi:hypothetical protein